MNKISLTLLIFIFPLLLFSQVTPDFSFNDSDGINHELYADYLNQDKVVFIEFMFIACPPCKAYLPYMKDLYAEYGSGNEDVEFFHFTTSFSDPNSDMADYKIEESIPFPMVGSDGSSIPTFNEYKSGTYGTFFGTPTFAIIKPNGEVTLARPPGDQSTWNPVLRDLIDEALGIQPPPPPPPPVTYNISGTILDAAGAAFETSASGDGLIIKLSGDTTLTTTDNPFTFENIPEGMNVEIIAESASDQILAGITTFDIVMISQYILGSIDLSLNQKIAGDVNCSGSLSTFDIINLRQLILYIENNLPCGSYKAVPASFIADPNSTIDAIESQISITNLDSDLNNQNMFLIKVGNINY